MNYICQDPRTERVLKTWSGVKGLYIFTFFFWNAGAPLEKSSEGLLRSLLYQILEKFPGLISLPYDSHSTLENAMSSQQGLRPNVAWTERRLQNMLQDILRQIKEVCRICIFIDGLDEISDDQDRLIAVVEDMVSAEVKVCVSSRPERSFSDAFGTGNMLRLQDLTEPDILTYIRDQLQQPLQKTSANDNEVSQILDSIAYKAQGVFLWVRLVVKTLINGLRNHDSLDQLRTRLESTPSDIEAMYEKMLSSIDVAHREEAALLFLMALNSMTGSLLNVTCVLCKEIYHVSIGSGQSAVPFSRQTLERIPTVGAGLLEAILKDKEFAKASEKQNGCHVIRVPHPSFPSYVTLPLRYACSSEMADLSYYERYVHVDFIHRTAVDFLLRSKQGQFFLREHTGPCFNLNSTYAKGLLAKVDSLGFPEKPKTIDPEFYELAGLPANFHADDRFDDYVDCVAGSFIRQVMHRVSSVDLHEPTRGLSEEEPMTDTAQFSLYDDVDSAIATIYQRQRVDAPIVHWVTRWHPREVFEDRRPSSASRSTTTARSSLSELFSSASGEPTLSSKEPIDFLGLAASWGLSHYVQTKVESLSNRLDKSYMSYLLSCSMPLLFPSREWSHYEHYVVAILHLTADLLSRGGNPNAYLGDLSSTLWGHFLGHCGSWGLKTFLPFSNATGKATATTAEAFLNAGADVHMTFSYTVHAFEPDREDGQLIWAVKRPQVSLCFEASPLYIVQQLLKTASEWKSVEDIISAKGGGVFHRYYRAFVDLGADHESFEISEKQHEDLIATLNLAHDKYVNQDHPYTDWVTIREKICRDYLNRFAESDKQTSSNHDDTSSTDEEDEFFECLDTQTVEDPQDDHLLEQ